ncbi:hypothetical protein [Candidatus Nitronereus thalassa]|uniref:Uncharacterized protein n=1 Tax=Candidatus Nitronereus thalassa TaxID=3020898 RepID=A0ABU3K5Q5_9BACT|nr:hypothetical protein [Candidatus Nitronereus thalassa]MDT7041747.1 hypothetical protein [Candidatus Nitronereus thalassa]
MEHDEELVFERVLDALDLPDPDRETKEKIMKTVFFILVAREIGMFHASIPGIFLDDLTNE